MIRYEFLMQIRKRSLWITTFLLAGLIAFTQGDRGPRHLPVDASARQVMGLWALLISIILPIGFGMLLADRLVRDRRLGVAELIDSTPAAAAPRLLRKYVGSTAATAVPGLAVLFLAAAGEFAHRHDPALLPWALVAFALVVLPGLAFVAAFALVLPLLVTTPLFRVLFVGYWFWGNLLSPTLLPSLTGSLLAPIGDYPASWLMGERALYAGAGGWLDFLRPEPSGPSTVISVVLLLVVGLVPLALAATVLHRRRVAG